MGQISQNTYTKREENLIFVSFIPSSRTNYEYVRKKRDPSNYADEIRLEVSSKYFLFEETLNLQSKS